MPYSYNEVGTISPGGTIQVPFPFLSRDHVGVLVDYAAVNSTLWSWLSDGLIKAEPGFPSGSITRVERNTPINNTQAKLSGSAVFEFEGVNVNDVQMLFALQELYDRQGYDGGLLRNTINRLNQEIFDRKVADRNIISLIGQAGPIEVPFYDTLQAASFAHIKSTINFISTGGNLEAGDGGASTFKRVTAEPVHEGKFQSADGAWWEELRRDGTLQFWKTQVVPRAQDEVKTTGFAQAGDGGASTFKRVTAEPVHEGKFQSADGAWWELIGDTVTPQQFGPFVGITGIDATKAFQAALDYLELRGGGTCRPVYGTYDITDILRAPSNVVIDGRAGMTVVRKSNANAMFLNKSSGLVGAYDASKNIRVVGGTWDANGTVFTAPVTLIAFGHAQNVQVKGATIINGAGAWHGVELNAVKNGKVLGCTFRNGGGNQLGGEAIQLDTALSGGPFPWFGPYDDTPCYKITIDDNLVEDWSTGVGSHSVPVDPSRRHSKIRISNNILNVTHCGISVLRWTDVTIEDNRLFGIQQDLAATDYSSWGIRVAADGAGRTTGIRIRNNVVDGFHRGRNASGNSRGIIVAGDPANLTRISRIWITGNYVVNSGRHGIGVDYSHGAHVVDNEVATHEQVGIYIYGSVACIIKGNAVEGRTMSTTYDIVITAAGNVGSGDHIVQGNRAGKLSCDAPRSLVDGNIIWESISASSALGKIGPNLVAGAWV
ncbi:NosD domain-containing protein [Brucella intermedia]|uniref:NosD domain-containing protein n=1 Tax=Brucella intermedia TaxID=94625 RepID=UPI00224AC6E7|nr:right-handed parallel beta-helix repeat-containing protein [Brucella intermedia]